MAIYEGGIPKCGIEIPMPKCKPVMEDHSETIKSLERTLEKPKLINMPDGTYTRINCGYVTHRNITGDQYIGWMEDCAREEAFYDLDNAIKFGVNSGLSTWEMRAIADIYELFE